MNSDPQKLPFVPPVEGCRVEHVHRTGPFVTQVELRLPDGTPWVWTSRRHRYLGGIRSLPVAAGSWDDKALWWLKVGLLARSSALGSGLTFQHFYLAGLISDC